MVEERFKNTLIWDIETAGELGAPSNTHKLRIFGCYSFNDEKYYLLEKESDIREMIDRHKYIVGFNSVGGMFHGDFFEGFDTRVMYYNGYSDIINKDKNDIYRFKNKINIDMMMVYKKRASAMKIKKGMLNDLLMRYSLDFISRTIGIVDDSNAKIDDFDYGLLQKEVNEWTNEERKLIEEYTMRDLEVTKKMYVWLEDYFASFKPYVSQDDVENKSYLTSSTAVLTYKSICNRLNIPEDYSDSKQSRAFIGGYVSYPAGEHFSGNIYCLDFNSLYPHILMMCNVTEPDPNGWSGNGVFKTLGKYSKTKLGEIPKLYIELYKERVELKKLGDPKEYALKIFLNSGYGIISNPCFSSVYSDPGGRDIPYIGRQFIKLARQRFKEAGYLNLANDTDSCYILDTFNDKEKLLKVKDSIIKEIKDNVPFPVDSFDMGVDDEITDMWFFQGENKNKSEDDSSLDEDDLENKKKNLLKKNYIYRTTDGKIKVKNLGVRKKSLSAISRKLFWDVLVPRISEERKVKFSESYLKTLINDMLEKDISLAEIRYTAKPADSYKSPSQIQAQIATRYGPGIHFLIPNTRGIGVGLKKNYCSLEEFKEHNLTVDDIDLTNVWKELGYFIKDSQTTLTSFLE
jgi:DNA polymerase elongation subunit (family B)